MSKTTKTLLIVGASLFAIVLIAVIGIALLAESVTKPNVPENSVLVLKITGSLPDYAPDNKWAKVFGIRQQQSFSNLLTELRKAKVDKRISGVLLDIQFPQIGWGKADELRDAIKDFRTSDKPIYSFMELGMNKDYYIAAATEKVFMPPAGDLYVNGFAANAMFYRGSLDKLGIEPEVIKIGKYKNAPDQYTEKEMSDAQREVINAVLDEYYKRFTGGIAADRKKSVEDVRAIVDNAPYHGTEAQQIGLIDRAIYRDQVDEEFKTRLGYKADDALRTVSANDYRGVPADSLGLDDGERVAVIYASGVINGGKSNNSPLGGEMVGSDTLIESVNEAADDPTIKAIVLRVDSPGGSSLASDLMWHSLETAKAKKPLVVSMGDVAASGGYYIACNANKIVAEPSTITGSIGVFMGKPVVKGLYDWLGVTNEYVLRGKNAGIFREDVKWSPAERAKMQDQANKIYYTDFVPKVAKGRGKTDEEVNSIGQGRVWTGTQGKQVGLVDEFGGLEKAIEIAKNLANIPAEKNVKRVTYPESQSLLSQYFGGDSETLADAKTQAAQAALIESLPEDAKKALRFAQLFDQMRNGEAMMLLPFELEIK